MRAILMDVGAVLIIIGVAMVIYQTGKIWPVSKRRAAKPEPEEGAKPSVPYSGVVVMGIGALMVAAAASMAP
jgi:hypothetical protein